MFGHEGKFGGQISRLRTLEKLAGWESPYVPRSQVSVRRSRVAEYKTTFLVSERRDSTKGTGWGLVVNRGTYLYEVIIQTDGVGSLEELPSPPWSKWNRGGVRSGYGRRLDRRRS